MYHISTRLYYWICKIQKTSQFQFCHLLLTPKCSEAYSFSLRRASPPDPRRGAVPMDPLGCCLHTIVHWGIVPIDAIIGSRFLARHVEWSDLSGRGLGRFNRPMIENDCHTGDWKFWGSKLHHAASKSVMTLKETWKCRWMLSIY